MHCCFTSTENSNSATASAFFGVFYILFVHTTNYAISETQGILGIKDQGELKFKFSFLRYKQSIFFSVVILILIYIPAALLFEKLINHLFSFDLKVAEISANMIFWSLPAFLFRCVNENSRVFLQNHQKSKYLGYCYILQVFTFGPLCFFIVNVIALKEKAYGCVLFYYEFFGILLHLFFVQEIWEDDDRIFELKFDFLSKIFVFLWVFLYKFLTIFIWDFVLIIDYFIISRRNRSEEIIAFALCTIFTVIVTTLGKKFSAGVKKIMEDSVKNEENEDIIEKIGDFKRIYLGIGFIYAAVCLAFFLTLELGGIFGGVGSKVRELMAIAKLYIAIRAFSSAHVGFHSCVSGLVGLGDKVVYTYSFPYYLSNFGSFVICSYFGFGVLGLIGFHAVYCLSGTLMMDGFLDDDLIDKRLNEIKYRDVERI